MCACQITRSGKYSDRRLRVVVTSVVVDSSGMVPLVLVLIDADSAPEDTDAEESEAIFFAHEDSAITRTNDNEIIRILLKLRIPTSPA